VVKNGFDYGTFSNRLWANSNDGLREYSALQFQAAYRAAKHLKFEGHYTLMLKDDGNQEGEGANTPGAPSPFPGYYPELFNQARSYPIGHLSGYQQHRFRVWGIYDLSLGRAGEINWGLLFSVDSGTAYSIRSTGQGLTSVQKSIGAQNYPPVGPGLPPDLPSTQTIFYPGTGRGSELFQGSHPVDISANYNVPVWKKVKPWVKVELRNIFNSMPLISTNISTKPDPSSPKDNLGIPTGYIKGAAFGTGTSTSNYPLPRTFLLSGGIRF
jgi:hypothetical protein